MQKDYAKSSSKQNRQLIVHGWRGRLLLVSIIVLIISLAGYGYDEYKKYANQWSFAAIKSWFVNKVTDRTKPRDRTSSTRVTKVQKTPQSSQENEVQFNFYTDLPNDRITITENEDKAHHAAAQTKQADSARLPLNGDKTISNTPNNSFVVSQSSPVIQPITDKPSTPDSVKPDPTKADKAKHDPTNPDSVKPSQTILDPVKPDQAKPDQTKPTTPYYIVQIAAFRNGSSAGDMRISLLLSGFEVNLVKTLDNEHTQIYLLQQGPFSSLSEAKAMQQKLKKRDIESVIKKVQ